MKKFAFRFDVDTHKCIRDGVPNLLEISEERCVPFTFFLNAGKAVSVKETLKAKAFSKAEDDGIRMMSAFKKLGMKDYMVAAILNPNNSMYKKNIHRLFDSKCEIGIHGGKNHAIWHSQASGWSKDRVKTEIQWAIDMIRKYESDYNPVGFASPGWILPAGLDEVLEELGIQYNANLRNWGGAV